MSELLSLFQALRGAAVVRARTSMMPQRGAALHLSSASVSILLPLTFILIAGLASATDCPNDLLPNESLPRTRPLPPTDWSPEKPFAQEVRRSIAFLHSVLRLSPLSYAHGLVTTHPTYACLTRRAASYVLTAHTPLRSRPSSSQSCFVTPSFRAGPHCSAGTPSTSRRRSPCCRA